MKYFVFALSLLASMLFAKEAEYVWDGKYQDVTFIKLVEHQPVTYVVKVRWITKTTTDAMPVEKGGDGIVGEIFKYQLADGTVQHTPALIWAPNTTGRFGDIVSWKGEMLSTPPPMKALVTCRCSGEIKSQKYVPVIMDGKPHVHGDVD